MATGPNPPQRYLHSHFACRHLTQLTLEHLPRDGSIGRTRTWTRGSQIWKPRDPADRVYFLLSGRVSVTSSNIQGHETASRTIHGGESFGELCFCSEQRHNFSKSLAASRTVEVRYDEFLEFVKDRQDVLHALVFTLCDRLSKADMRIDSLAHRGAQQRLGTLLLHLASSQAANGRGDEAILHISHQELADLAAMTRPHVTSTMGVFRRRGLVNYERGKPLRVHVAALRAYFDGEKGLV